MGTLLRTAIRVRGGRIRQAFDRATRNPAAAQKQVLLEILRANQETEYGQRHGFAGIPGSDAFAGAVPVNAFTDLSPYVERMKRGDANVLTRERPVMFNLTSGTTDSPKYVPVTPEGMARCAARSRQWLYRALRDHAAFLDGAIVCMCGAAVEGRTESGIPYGSASGMIYESLPRVLRRSFALPFRLSEIRDYDLRYFAMARMALARDVSFVVTPNPATLVRLAETGLRFTEEIIRSIRDGTLCSPPSLLAEEGDARILEAVRATLSPEPRRARFLESVVRAQGGLVPSACWPRLKLIGCWLGGTIGFQVDRLVPYFGADVSRRDIGYLASEGSMSIPYRDGTPEGILALHDNFYEFIPAGERAVDGERPLQCHEIEEGRQYRIILTNRSGLYRYDIDDIVEVRGFYNRAPVIAFVRKGGEVLNITGEKVHANQYLGAFRKLRQAFGLPSTPFKVVPDYAGLRHDILIAPGTRLSREFMRDTLLPRFDRLLSACNLEYDSRRKSGRLNAPCLHVMDASWVDDVRRDCAASGRPDVQYKWRTVAPARSAVDDRHVEQAVTCQMNRTAHTVRVQGGPRRPDAVEPVGCLDRRQQGPKAFPVSLQAPGRRYAVGTPASTVSVSLYG